LNLLSHAGFVRPSAVELDASRELVKRVLASHRFNRSPRLQRFLAYVCDAALEDRIEDINEQRIGERVFGRPESYNAAEDNVVRSQARILRQKLDAYFANEGAAETLVLGIPKGGYVPEFTHRTPGPAPLTPEIDSPSGRNRLVTGLTFAVVILSLTVVGLAWSMMRSRSLAPRSESAASPELKALWSQLFSERTPTTVVVPDSTFYLTQEASGKQADLDAYVARSTLEESPGFRQLEQLLPRFSTRRYTTFDGVSTAIRVLQIATKFPGKVVVRYARDVTLHDLSPGNLILIGRPSSNLWEELFRSKLNFRIGMDSHHATWSNASPLPGEETEFVPKLDGNRYYAYGSVAFLPNINGGNVLLIAGSNSNSQEGAAQFATDENLLRLFSQKIGLKGKNLPYFDALLRITTVGDVSEQPSLAAYRLLPRQ
jgi:hypothetical protein